MSDQFQEDYARDIWGVNYLVTTSDTTANENIVSWDSTSYTITSDAQQLLYLIVQLIDILKPTVKHEGILNIFKEIEILSGRFETPIEDPEDDLYKID